MSTFLKRLFGIFLVLLALAGLILSIYGFWRISGLKETLIPKVESWFQLVDDTLNTTNQALDVVESTLGTVSSNISSIQDALLTLAQSFHGVDPLLDSLSTLTGKTLPDTLTSTHTSLVTAQTTAKTIEDILSLITRIPLMPGDPYNPEVPLYTSLGQVASDLDKIQPQLKIMDQELVNSKTNLSGLESDITQVSQDLMQINRNLASAVDTVNQYRELTNKLQTRLNDLRAQIPGWISIAIIFLAFILFWIAVYQVDLFFRGIKLIRLKG